MSKQKNKIVAPLVHGICHLAIIPVRKRSEDQAEMVTQLLFGELVHILERKNKSWIRIQCSYDGYEGWVDPKQITLLTDKQFKAYENSYGIALDTVSGAINGDHSTQVLLGSSLPAFDGMSFTMPDGQYVYNGQAIMTQDRQPSVELLLKLSRKYINAPYLWGGRSPFGIDCSGFTQMVFKMMGISLPRDAYQQAELGDLVAFVDVAKEGDLAFFINKEDRIHHVGIVYGQNKIIHASGKVRVDYLDHEGIYNEDIKKYTHKLAFVRDVLFSYL